MEQGRAPATLATSTRNSTGEMLTRKNVCRYPLVTKYTGQGDPADASSYRCADLNHPSGWRSEAAGAATLLLVPY